MGSIAVKDMLEICTSLMFAKQSKLPVSPPQTPCKRLQVRWALQSKLSFSKASPGSLFSLHRLFPGGLHHKNVSSFSQFVPGNVPTSETGKGQVTTANESTQFDNFIWPSPTDDIPFWKQKSARKIVLSDSSKRDDYRALPAEKSTSHDPDPLHVVHVTAEMAPIAKVGGLGDVVTGLARACLERGHQVEVILPFYECILKDEVADLNVVGTYPSYHNGDWIPVTLYKGKVSKIPVFFIQPSNHFFKGSRIYGGSYNELEAYLFFSRACLEWMQVSGFHPDIIHVHDWHTGALPLLYWDMYHELSVKKPRIVITIHNMEHYGECRVEQLNMCGLDGPIYCSVDKAIDDRTIGHNPERLSLLKGAIVYSNAVTTVSPTYANETMCSGWLASTLMQYKEKYIGILNGIDIGLWDPTKDAYLPSPFGAKNLEGKYICKHYVQRGLGLDSSVTFQTKDDFLSLSRQLPLVICITRLVAQKGIHLIRYAMKRIEQLGGQFVLLGSTPDTRVQKEFEYLADQYKESKNVRLLLTYSEELAHMLNAAADMVLVPSLFEPCGLTQMIGMRYGAIPIVRRTGGLADTVFDVDELSTMSKGNGFVFQGIDEASLNAALERAFQYYYGRYSWWVDLTSKVMRLDNSWNKSAGEYVNLYNSIRVR